MVAPSREPVPLHTAENIADLANPTYIGAPPYTGAWNGASYDPEKPPQVAPGGLYSTDQIKVDVSLVDVVRAWSKDVIRGGFTDEFAMLEFSREWFRQRAGGSGAYGGSPRGAAAPAGDERAGASLDAGMNTRLDPEAEARRNREEAEADMARAEGATEAEVEEERIAAYVYEAEEIEAEAALEAAVAAATPAGTTGTAAAQPAAAKAASSFDFEKGTFIFG